MLMKSSTGLPTPLKVKQGNKIGILAKQQNFNLWVQELFRYTILRTTHWSILGNSTLYIYNNLSAVHHHFHIVKSWLDVLTSCLQLLHETLIFPSIKLPLSASSTTTWEASPGWTSPSTSTWNSLSFWWGWLWSQSFYPLSTTSGCLSICKITCIEFCIEITVGKFRTYC